MIYKSIKKGDGCVARPEKIMKKRILFLLTTMLLTSSVITACGGSGSYASKSNGTYDSRQYESAAAGAADEDAAEPEYADDYYAEESAEGEKGSDNTGFDSDSNSFPDDSGENVTLRKDKLVYHANVSISTKKFDDTLSGCRALANKYEAIIQSENFSDSDTSWYTSEEYRSRNGYSRYYTVELRIPSKNFESFLNSAGDLEGVITNRDSNVTNISAQYYDAQEEMKAYEAELTRLYALMDQATEMSDILTLEERITTVQTSLNQVKSSLRTMDTDVAYSYITLNIDEVAPSAVITETDEPTFGEKLKEAFSHSISAFVKFIQAIILILASTWPFLILLALVIILIVRLIINLDRKSKKKHAQQFEAMRQNPPINNASNNIPVNFDKHNIPENSNNDQNKNNK